jgi:hypothetical protein
VCDLKMETIPKVEKRHTKSETSSPRGEKGKAHSEPPSPAIERVGDVPLDPMTLLAGE